MDSLTQITLGAAVGEIVLGKKVGNRAMLWGAVAGTIPDLDIIGNLWMSRLDALAFHRGISHSIFFAVVAAPVLGYLVHRFYQSGLDRNKYYKIFASAIPSMLFLYLFGYLIFFTGSGFNTTPLIIALVLGALFGYRIYKYNTNSYSDLGTQGSFTEWSMLFFWGLFTHALLDCFTTYGTQLFQPFSNYRVAFCNISVADPLYTFPFLGFLIAASYAKRDSLLRFRLNWAGIVVSSLYMSLTLFNKIEVEKVMENSLQHAGIESKRHMTTPSIFNNILWSVIVEAEDTYYYADYSLFDKGPYMEFTPIEKNHEVLTEQFGPDNDEINVLKWFTDNFYTVDRNGDGEVRFNDMRFGIISGLDEGEASSEDFVFSFRVWKSGEEVLIKSIDRDRSQMGNDLAKLMKRIKGKQAN